MDKKELKEDLIRDRIIDSIQYISDQWQYVIGLLTVIILTISAYGFYSNKENKRIKLSSEMSGLAQSEYNQGDIEFAVEDLENVLGDYEDTHGGTQAYIYLIYDAYINDDFAKLESLLNDYSMYTDDALLESSVLETKAYLSNNDNDFDSAIELLNKAMSINDIDAFKVRFGIAKARVCINKEDYKKASDILIELGDSKFSSTSQQNTIDELKSYIAHIDRK